MGKWMWGFPTSLPRARECIYLAQMIVLHRAASPGPLWREVAVPWLMRAAQEAWRDELPWVVVTPQRSLTADFKSRWASSAAGAVGVRFWTVGQLRRVMADGRGELNVWSRHSLALILRTVAAAHGSEFARAVLREPSLVLESLLALSRAGKKPESLVEIAPEGKAVLEDFFALLRGCGRGLVGEAESGLLEQGSSLKVLFSQILFWGFDASHWDDYLLLRLAADSCHEATMCALTGLVEDCWCEAVWQSSWESSGEVWQDHAEDVVPTEGFGGSEIFPEVRVVESQDEAREAAEVVAATLRILQGDPEACVVIGLPGRGTLHSEILSAFGALEAPLYDGIGRVVKGEVAEVIGLWRRLHRQWNASSLVEFVRLCPAAASLWGFKSAEEFIDRIMRAVADILDEDLERVQIWWRSRGEGHVPRRRLSDLAPLEWHLRQFRQEFEAMGLGNLIRAAVEELNAVCGVLKGEVPGTVFLDWLDDFYCASQEKGDGLERQFFARIVLCQIEQVVWRAGRYVILAGLNDGIWPRSGKALWFDPLEVRAINSGNTRQAASGSGEKCVVAGRALLVDQTLSESVSVRLATLALLNSRRSAILFRAAGDSLTGRPLQPSILFFDLQKYGIRVLDSDYRSLAASVEDQVLEFAPPAVVTKVEDTLRARQARLRVEMGTGDYDFKTDVLPVRVEPVSVTSWSSAFEQPPVFWLREILRVRRMESVEEVMSFQSLLGRLVHEMLRVPGQEFSATENLGSFIALAKNRAREVSSVYANVLMERNYVSLPMKLQFALGQATSVAEEIARVMDSFRWPPQICCEWRAPTLDICTGLRLSGRLDVVLRDSTGKIMWVVDYKTSRDQFNKSEERIQLSTYVKMVFQKQGVLPNSCVVAPGGMRSILSVEDRLKKSNVEEEELLLLMWREKRFPLRAAVRSRFGYTPVLPLATLPVPVEVLRDRWENWLGTGEQSFSDDESLGDLG